MASEGEQVATLKGPVDLFARFQADGGGECEGDGNEETHRAALGTDGLDFDGVVDLHAGRLLYKVAIVKEEHDDESTEDQGATDIL